MIYQPIPAEYHKINTAIQKDFTKKYVDIKMSIMFNQIYVCEPLWVPDTCDLVPDLTEFRKYMHRNNKWQIDLF